jgi:hypothetical protein
VPAQPTRTQTKETNETNKKTQKQKKQSFQDSEARNQRNQSSLKPKHGPTVSETLFFWVSLFCFWFLWFLVSESWKLFVLFWFCFVFVFFGFFGLGPCGLGWPSAGTSDGQCPKLPSNVAQPRPAPRTGHRGSWQ